MSATNVTARRRPKAAGLLTRVALGWVALVVAFCFLGPLWAPDPNLVTAGERLQPPGSAHLLGTDHLGRDLMARLMEGGRVSLTIIALVITSTVLLGFVTGVLAGYLGGIVDASLSRLFDMLAAIPTLLLAILIVAAVGPSTTTVIIALTIGELPLYGRLFRAGTISVKNREYVLGVRSLGLPGFRIVLAHITPNIVTPVLVVAAGNMGRIAIDEAALSYLGAGVQPPDASWGNLISQGQEFLQFAPWFPMAPGIALTLLALAFSFVGDGLRDRFDVKDGR